MIIKQCPDCKGDGFRRVPKGQVHPMTNIFNVRLVRKEVPLTGDVLFDYHRSIIAYDFKCHRCRETGELKWSRGVSLTPILGEKVGSNHGSALPK